MASGIVKTAPNFKSGTVWVGDNLPVLRGMNSNSVDLIYLDPPFNSNRNYEAPIGSTAAGVSFKDMWTLDDIDVHEHGELADRNPGAYSVIESARQVYGKGMMSYLDSRHLAPTTAVMSTAPRPVSSARSELDLFFRFPPKKDSSISAGPSRGLP